MKPIDLKIDSYAKYNEDSNEKKNPKFKVSERVKILKYKNIFAKECTKNQPEVFVVRNFKNTVPWTDVISNLKNQSRKIKNRKGT